MVTLTINYIATGFMHLSKIYLILTKESPLRNIRLYANILRKALKT